MFGMFDPVCPLQLCAENHGDHNSRNLFGVLQGLAQYKMGPQHVYISRVKIPLSRVDKPYLPMYFRPFIGGPHFNPIYKDRFSVPIL